MAMSTVSPSTKALRDYFFAALDPKTSLDGGFGRPRYNVEMNTLEGAWKALALTGISPSQVDPPGKEGQAINRLLLLLTQKVLVSSSAIEHHLWLTTGQSMFESMLDFGLSVSRSGPRHTGYGLVKWAQALQEDAPEGLESQQLLESIIERFEQAGLDPSFPMDPRAPAGPSWGDCMAPWCPGWGARWHERRLLAAVPAALASSSDRAVRSGRSRF